MTGPGRKIIPVLWLCVALGLFIGLGSPVFSESYGVHDHLLVADTGDNGKTHHHHTPDPGTG